jgi:hypothetical protein
MFSCSGQKEDRPETVRMKISTLRNIDSLHAKQFHRKSMWKAKQGNLNLYFNL